MERPILFSALMVKAILEGRKTQTRRVMKPQPAAGTSRLLGEIWDGWVEQHDHPTKSVTTGEPLVWSTTGKLHRCPYGQPGDRLWVRETWYCDHVFAGDFEKSRSSYYDPKPTDEKILAEWKDLLYYRATDCDPSGRCYTGFSGETMDPPWRPSIHMPRWASRLLLEVVEVRAERLQDITEEDARAEGVQPDVDWSYFVGPCRHGRDPWTRCDADERGEEPCDYTRAGGNVFAALWDSINGKRAPWASNPWVWVVSFKRIQPETGGAK
jgi:hypothetical protein